MRNENNRAHIQDNFKNLKEYLRNEDTFLGNEKWIYYENQNQRKNYNTRQNLDLKIIH